MFNSGAKYYCPVPGGANDSYSTALIVQIIHCTIRNVLEKSL